MTLTTKNLFSFLVGIAAVSVASISAMRLAEATTQPTGGTTEIRDKLKESSTIIPDELREKLPEMLTPEALEALKIAATKYPEVRNCWERITSSKKNMRNTEEMITSGMRF